MRTRSNVCSGMTTLAALSIADNGTIRLPFGTGRTSPIATDDVARVVTTILTDPGPYIGRVVELTGPRSQDMNGVADEYARALNRPVSYVDVPWDTPCHRTLPAGSVTVKAIFTSPE